MTKIIKVNYLDMSPRQMRALRANAHAECGARLMSEGKPAATCYVAQLTTLFRLARRVR